MKLKQSPEDFRVEEISTAQVQKDPAEYKIYFLEKKNAETFALISHLSAVNRIPAHEFGIAGLKDKHALTKQYFSIPSKYKLKTGEEKNFKIVFAGYSKNRIKLGDLKGNKFEITARGIKKGEIEGIKHKAESIKEIGAPNYYDSQRFGSASCGEFIIKHAMKNDYETAAQIYLTAYTKSESKTLKSDKRSISENWHSIENIRPKTKHLAKVIEEYKRTKSWQSAYRKIPSKMRELYVSAYQSYLWNECLKEILRRNAKHLYTVEYKMGSLLFYKKPCALPETLSTISDDMKIKPEEKEAVERILAREGLNLEDFRIRSKTGNFFKSHERKTILMPEGLKTGSFEDDGKNTYKLRIEFTLPKGSYATIITKRLFNK